MKKLLLAAIAALSIGQAQAQGTFPGRGLVESTVATPTALGSATLNTNTTTMSVTSVIAGNIPCPLSYSKGTNSATGVFGEVLNAPSGIYWEPQYQAVPIIVCQFGAVGDNSHDDTANIQAAIDWGSTRTPPLGQVNLTPGANYKITSPLYLDIPNNLRANIPSSWTNPASGNFSMSLDGGQGPGVSPGVASLRATFPAANIPPGNVPNYTCGLWVGPGQGMRVANLALFGPGQQTPPLGVFNGLSIGGKGVCVAANGIGASRTLIDNVTVFDFYESIAIDPAKNGSLGDSTTIRKCNLRGAVGVHINSFNTLINRIDECVMENTIDVIDDGFNGAMVTGGNFSIPAAAALPYTISTVTATPGTFQGGGFTAWPINVQLTVTSPDNIIKSAQVYTGYAIKTTHFGVVPMTLTSYNTSTNVAQFAVTDVYSAHYFNTGNGGAGGDPCTLTNLCAEIAAATTLYAAEINVVFSGVEYHVDDLHIENGYVPTQLYRDQHDSCNQGQAHSVFKGVRFAGDFANGTYGYTIANGLTPNNQGLAAYYVSRSFPAMYVGCTAVHIEDFSNLIPTQDYAIIDCKNSNCMMTARGQLPPMQTRIPINAYAFTNGTDIPAGVLGVPPAMGIGTFYDGSPFLTTQIQTPGGVGLGTIFVNGADSIRSAWGQGRCVMFGVRPAPYCEPGVTPTQLTNLQMSPPNGVSLAAPAQSYLPWVVNYPLLYGGQAYKISSHAGFANSTTFSPTISALPTLPTGTQWHFVSNHHFYSYGQALTGVTASYVSPSQFLYVTDTRLFFPGLGLIINNGSGNQLVMVDGVYPVLGCVTVIAVTQNELASGNGPWWMTGTKGTSFTGLTPGQEAYTITRF